MRLRKAGVAALVAAALSVPVDASAVDWTIRDEFEPQTRRHQLDLVASLAVTRRFGFWPGLLYAFPVAPQGFISALNDCFFIEAGAIFGAFFGDPVFFWLNPQAGVRWSFYLTQEWAVFAALRAGWAFEFTDFADFDGFFISGTLGAHYHFSEDFALRLETGGGAFGYNATVGLSWQLPIEF